MDALAPQVVDAELVSATDLAVAPREEPKLQRLMCNACGEKWSSRQDGMCAACSGFRLTRKAAREYARERLERRAPWLVSQFEKAVVIAAEKGKTSGIQWALEGIRVVEPVAKTPVNVGVVVQIGRVLPGLKEGV